jgi:hypothetical protein
MHLLPPPHVLPVPAHPILLNLINLITFGEQYRSRSCSLCSFLHSRYLIPLRPKYYPQHPILKNPQPIFFAQCKQQNFTPIKTTGKLTVLDISMGILLDSKLDDQMFCTKWQRAFPDFNALTPAIIFHILRNQELWKHKQKEEAVWSTQITPVLPTGRQKFLQYFKQYSEYFAVLRNFYLIHKSHGIPTNVLVGKLA